MDLSPYESIEAKRLALALYIARRTQCAADEATKFASCIEADSDSSHVDYIISVARGYCRLRDDVEKATNFSELGAIQKRIKGTPYAPFIERFIKLKSDWLLLDENQPFPLWGNN